MGHRVAQQKATHGLVCSTRGASINLLKNIWLKRGDENIQAITSMIIQIQLKIYKQDTLKIDHGRGKW